MILSALNSYYQRLLAREEADLSPFGYSQEKISFEILLAPDGTVVDVNDIRDTSGKKAVPRSLIVPQPEKRAAGIKSNFLWDKTSYVLGVSGASKRTVKEHEAFKTLHRHGLTGATDPGLLALLAFIDKWTPDQFQALRHKEEMLDTNVVFRLDGDRVHLHDRPAAKLVRAKLLSPDEGRADSCPVSADRLCLVTGLHLPIARLHASIKGVNGAQSAGASIVSFNLDAFTSYGKIQGDNAPISQQAAFAYTTALNHLLRRSNHNRQRIQIGDASVVFWAEADSRQEAEAAELLLEQMLNPPSDDAQEAEKLRHVLDRIAKGQPMRDARPDLDEGTRMFVLGLAPNASRLSIRFWQCDTLDRFTRRLAQHDEDMHIEPRPWTSVPPAWRLVLATAPSRDGRAKPEDAPPQLAGELMRSILSGAAYPRSLLSTMIMRMRADGEVSAMRVAICKGVLTRGRRLATQGHQEEVPVSLDPQSTNPGYLLGRLFAVLENVQRSALGGQINATIRDRYYGAASATPATVFPVLLRNTQNHLSRLRKDKPGLAVNMEKEIREIVDGLCERFPRSLRIEDQGRFAIGYYHQSQARFHKSDAGETSTTGIDAGKQGAVA